jgi:GNAT superfamily N-acetyltransferase
VADPEHDARIAELSRALGQVAQQEGVPYLDTFTPLHGSALWRAEVAGNDGSHPRSGGYRELAALVTHWPAWWFHQPPTRVARRPLAQHAVRVADSDDDIAACFPVMAQLRPHLAATEFVPRVRRQMADGFRLAVLREGGTVQAVAGYRVGENLAWGKFLYVDDLVTAADQRSRGCGRALLAWLRAEARRQGCAQLHLDSGTARKDAHRFYLREQLDLAGYHFAQRVDRDDP